MEYKTKTIIWEDNNEPPKNYIWAKKDGKFYEYSYVTKSWIESKLIKAEESGGSDGGDGGGGSSEGSVDINTILDNISIKDDLLTKLQAIDYTNQDPDDGILTDLTFDDVFNDYNDFIKSLLYREEYPSIPTIQLYPEGLEFDYLTIGGNTIQFKIIGPHSIYSVIYSVFIFVNYDNNNNIEIWVRKMGIGPA